MAYQKHLYTCVSAACVFPCRKHGNKEKQSIMIAVSHYWRAGTAKNMKIYRFWRLLFLTATATILAGAAIADETAPKEPQAGGDYILVEPPQPMRVAAGKLEIREFFNFSCPHCFRLQGPFSRWRNESDLSDIVIIINRLSLTVSRSLRPRLLHNGGTGFGERILRQDVCRHSSQPKITKQQRAFYYWLEEEAGADSDTAEKVYDSFTVSTKRREPRMPPLFMALTARHSLLLPENTY